MRRTKLATLSLAALLMPGLTSAAERQLGPHVHGHGSLNIAIEDNHVSLELEAPGMDIAGFEHSPATPEQKATAKAAEEKLKDGLHLFALPADAGCKLDKVEVAVEQEGGEHEHAPTHESHHDGDHHEAGDSGEETDGHNEFRATYTLTCAQPAAIQTVRFNYFETFPRAEALTVKLVSADRQSSFEVSRGQPDLQLKEGM